MWKAAIVALQYLLDDQGPLKQELATEETSSSCSPNNNNDHDSTAVAELTFSCLELGCGLGVPGMLLHRLFPTSRVVLTDCDALLEQLQHNLQQNFVNSNSITAATLDWTNDDELQALLRDCQLDAFDVVLNCDCIYEPLYGESWKALLQVQVALLKRKHNTLMLTSLERRKFDGADRYLAALNAHPHVEKVGLVHVSEPVEIYRIYGTDA